MKWLLEIIMPTQASTIAGEVDAIIYFILLLSIFFFLLITAGIIILSVKYRRRGKPGLTTSKDTNHVLEMTWTIIPSILLLIVFVWGFQVYLKMAVPPSDSMEVKVTGQRWFWTFDYDNGTVLTNELVVPVGKPVKLLISSKDVIHSIFVPAFRIKMDALPNRYTLAWFEATKEGDYPLYCTEFCGTSHSNMIGIVKVLDQEAYAKWLKESDSATAGSLTPAENGAIIYKESACFSCHSLDGSNLSGPSWRGIFGKKGALADGSFVTVDENYIRESILEPQAKITKGYQPVMPTYQGILNDKQIDAIIAFMKTLKE